VTRGGVIAATAGALLVVSLLLSAAFALVSVILIALVVIRPADDIGSGATRS
jgi:hypothetical protein